MISSKLIAAWPLVVVLASAQKAALRTFDPKAPPPRASSASVVNEQAANAAASTLPAQLPLGTCPMVHQGTKVEATVTATLQSSGLYLYQYSFKNVGAKDVSDIMVSVGNVVEPLSITSPANWEHGYSYADRSLLHWAAVLPTVPIEDEHKFHPPVAAIKPGQTLAGFSFQTELPPGPAPLLVGTPGAPYDITGHAITANSLEELAALVEEASEDFIERNCDTSDEATFVFSLTRAPINSHPAVIQINPTRSGPIDLGLTPVLRVAVISTASFSGLTVDPATARLGRLKVAPSAHLLQDVNGDGKDDLLLQFPAPALKLRCLDTALFLTGKTLTGAAFQGGSGIQIVGCP